MKKAVTSEISFGNVSIHLCVYMGISLFEGSLTDRLLRAVMYILRTKTYSSKYSKLMLIEIFIHECIQLEFNGEIANLKYCCKEMNKIHFTHGPRFRLFSVH